MAEASWVQRFCESRRQKRCPRLLVVARLAGERAETRTRPTSADLGLVTARAAAAAAHFRPAAAAVPAAIMGKGGMDYPGQELSEKIYIYLIPAFGARGRRRSQIC